jgi:hypothetical protein
VYVGGARGIRARRTAAGHHQVVCIIDRIIFVAYASCGPWLCILTLLHQVRQAACIGIVCAFLLFMPCVLTAEKFVIVADCKEFVRVFHSVSFVLDTYFMRHAAGIFSRWMISNYFASLHQQALLIGSCRN